MFDELNYFEYDKEDIEERFRQYFREMPDITEEQVEERKDVALEIFFLMLFFMGMVKATDEANQYQDLDYYIEMLGRRYEDIVNNRYGYSQSLSEYTPIFARSVVNTTFSADDRESMLDVSRAVNIGENEANTIVNEADFNRAVEKGYKYKKWLTEGDTKVRKTHKTVNGKIVPIDKYFKVGLSEMRFPHDLSKSPDPKEYIRCRCHVEYTNRVENANKNDKINSSNKYTRAGIFVDSKEDLSEYAKNIKPIDGYDDFVCHATPDNFLIYDGEYEMEYTAKEFAELVRNSKDFHGKPIRIISCSAGAKKDGIAQQLADELNVDVLAPTEDVTVDDMGRMFVSSNDVLSEMWVEAKDIEKSNYKETGYWRVFKPRKE